MDKKTKEYFYEVKLPTNERVGVFAEGQRIEEGLLYFYDSTGVTYVFNQWLYYQKVSEVEDEDE